MDSKEPLSGYAELAGGVSAFGGLGRDFGRLGGSFGRLGRSGSSGTLPTTPVLAITSLSTDNTPEFTIDVDDTVVAGDTVRLQVAATGTAFASPISDTTHTITSGEDAANEIDLSLVALPNATYDARALVHHTTDSAWSNTVTFTIAATTSSTFYILGF